VFFNCYRQWPGSCGCDDLSHYDTCTCKHSVDCYYTYRVYGFLFPRKTCY
jgi:hypothetical protein